MQVEFVDPFVRAIFCVLETLSEDDPERGPLSMRGVNTTTQQVTILLGVSGDICGKVLYGMSVVTAQKIAFAMIGQPIKEMDDMAWSAVGELGNTISRNALRCLEQAGLKCEITPPSVLRGMSVELSTDVAALVVPVATKLGRIEIDIALTNQVMAEVA